MLPSRVLSRCKGPKTSAGAIGMAGLAPAPWRSGEGGCAEPLKPMPTYRNAGQRCSFFLGVLVGGSWIASIYPSDVGAIHLTRLAMGPATRMIAPGLSWTGYETLVAQEYLCSGDP